VESFVKNGNLARLSPNIMRLKRQKQHINWKLQWHRTVSLWQHGSRL